MIAELRASREAALHAYVDGQLSPIERARMEAYLARRPLEAARAAAYRAQNLRLHALSYAASEPISPGLQELAGRLARRMARAALLERALSAGIVLALLAATVAVAPLFRGEQARSWLPASAMMATRSAAGAAETLVRRRHEASGGAVAPAAAKK